MTAKKRHKKVSGPSGRNTKPGILLRAADHELDAWKAAAASGPEPTTLTQWARDTLNVAAMRAGFEPGMRAHVRRTWSAARKVRSQLR